MKIAVTGHRPNKLGDDYNGTSALVAMIKVKMQQVIEQYKPDIMISGMALGIDQIWAEMAHLNNIKLIAAVPFAGQEDRWPLKSQRKYFELINNKNTELYVVSPPGYSVQKMQIRNQWMVDNCDMLLAVWDGSQGGTANCVEYARLVHKSIIRINPAKLLPNETP